MLIFGHTGITLGIAILSSRALSKSYSASTEENRGRKKLESSPELPSAQNHRGRASWVTSLANHADIRLLLIGSLLPDFIDKPMGQIFFRDTFSNGRIFCHTLLFLILITLAGLYLYRRRSKSWLLVLSFGTLTHLVFDQMWRAPLTLLWPIYGFVFERIDLTFWTPNILDALLTEPEVYLPELVGATILIWFAQTLVRRRKVCAFIKYGQA